MKDRLIELIKKSKSDCNNANCGFCGLAKFGGFPDCQYTRLAENIHADGWIRPPCKAGQHVYQVTRDCVSEFRVRFIEIATCGNMFLHTDLISGINYTGETFLESEVGESVFLTREEAEAKLKEGGKS